jgi:hypothetical protein
MPDRAFENGLPMRLSDSKKTEKGIRESTVTQLNRNPLRPVSWSKVSQVNFGLLSK